MAPTTRVQTATGRILAACLVLATAMAASYLPALGDLAAWSKLGVDGNRVTALATDPAQPTTIYAGTAGHGVYRSLDRGFTWIQAGAGLGSPYVNDLMVDPSNGANLLAATGRGPAVGEPADGVYRSTDRGSTWTRVLSTATTYSLARDPQNPMIIYAGGGPPVHRSADGGLTWSPAFQQGSDMMNVDIRAVAVHPADGRIVLAAGNTEGGQGMLFRSSDSGGSWTRVLSSQPPILDLKFAAGNQGGVVAFLGTLTGVSRSTDGGLNWEQVSEELGELPVRRLAPNPSNAGEVVAATDRGVIRSTNQGTDWTTLNQELGTLDLSSLAYDRAGQQTLYAGASDGVWAYTFPRSPTPTPATPTPAGPTPTPPGTRWYFAEGSTQQPFQTWFLVQNPTGSAASVRFTFQLEGGSTQVRDVTVAGNSRYSLFANQLIPDAAFSTLVESSGQIFVERSMFVGFDGSAITGIASPRQSWLFAEGATVDPFHTWVLVQNPNPVPANALITYLLRDRPPVVRSLGPLAPGSRTSIFVNQQLPNEEFSIRLESDQPVIAERSMFRFPGNAASAVSGAAETSRAWYFAEGNSTQLPPLPADSFLLLQNPQPRQAAVNITLFGVVGQQPSLQLVLAPDSRRTIYLNDIFPNASFGIRVESSEPIVAERSEFFGPEPRGAAASVGATTLATQWNLPEGSAQAPFTTAIGILNPQPDAMNARVDFLLENGQVVTREYVVGPSRLLTVNANDVVPGNAFSTRVLLSIPGVVERTMFFQKSGATGVTSTVGIPR